MIDQPTSSVALPPLPDGTRLSPDCPYALDALASPIYIRELTPPERKVLHALANRSTGGVCRVPLRELTRLLHLGSSDLVESLHGLAEHGLCGVALDRRRAVVYADFRVSGPTKLKSLSRSRESAA